MYVCVCTYAKATLVALPLSCRPVPCRSLLVQRSFWHVSAEQPGPSTSTQPASNLLSGAGARHLRRCFHVLTAGGSRWICRGLGLVGPQHPAASIDTYSGMMDLVFLLALDCGLLSCSASLPFLQNPEHKHYALLFRCMPRQGLAPP